MKKYTNVIRAAPRVSTTAVTHPINTQPPPRVVTKKRTSNKIKATHKQTLAGPAMNT